MVGRPGAVGLLACQIAVVGAAVSAAATRGHSSADAKVRQVLNTAGLRILGDREQCPPSAFQGGALHGLPCQRVLTVTAAHGVVTLDRVQAALVADGWRAYCGPRERNGATVLALEAADQTQSVVVISQPGNSDLVLAYTRWRGPQRLSCA